MTSARRIGEHPQPSSLSAKSALARRTGRSLLVGAACVSVIATAACTVPSDSAGAGNKGNQTLVINEWTNPGAIDATEKINAIFEKQHPGVTVKISQAPTADNAWSTLVNSQLAAKSVDILAQFAPTQSGFPPAYTGQKPGGTASLITSNQLTDLSSQSFMGRYDKSSQEWAIGHNGGIYGVMAAEYGHDGGLWYKPALLAKYNMKVPSTFDEFMADLKTFKSHGITPIFVAGKDNLQLAIWNGLLDDLAMQGKPSSDAAKVGADRAKAFWTGHENWNSATYQKAGAEYSQIMNYIEPAAGGVTEYTSPALWASKPNDFPFLIDGSYDFTTISKANPGQKVGYFTLPATNNPADNRLILAPDLTWTVPVWAKHKQLALDWLKLFSQESSYKIWLQDTGSVSTQPGVSVSTSGDWGAWIQAHMKTSFPGLISPWVPTGAGTDASGPDLTKVAPIGKESMKDALNKSAQAYTKSIKK